MHHFDAVVIGSGQGGNPVAADLAGRGMNVALVERTHVGGSCVNEGCTPTKTMVASARVAYLARRAHDYGVEIGPASMNMKTVRKRKRDIVDMFRSGSEKHIADTENLTLFRGEATFRGKREIAVVGDNQETAITGDKIVINTGARPRVPSISGIETINYLTSTSIMELAEVPEHLVVLGGGYVGVEFSQMFRRFGSSVTILQRRDQLLPHEDRDIADAVRDVLTEDGIDVRLSSQVTAVSSSSRGNGGDVEVSVDREGKSTSVAGSHLLVAAGRVPNTDMLNLSSAGIETDSRGHIKADNKLRTTAPDVYVIGDVKGGPAFTHVSYDDYRVLTDQLFGTGAYTVDQRLLSYVVFMDPQLGRVGLSEQQARESGREVLIGTMPMTSVARALETDETRGMMKAVVDKDSGILLGASVLGIQGGELMSALQIAMMGNLHYSALRDAPFSHPTIAEAFNTLFASLQ